MKWIKKIFHLSCTLTICVALVSCSKKDGEINKQLETQVNSTEKETMLDEEDTYDLTRPINDFKTATNDSKTTSEKALNELPKLEVSVSKTKLNYVGSKIDWNGEKEEGIEFSDIMDDTIPVFEYPNIAKNYTENICLSFADEQSTKITVQDYLLTESGELMFQFDSIIERDVRYGDDGNYYIDLVQHLALFLSSNSNTYTNPSYRGFRITCEFGENQICEYAFVLSVAPQIEENKLTCYGIRF